MLSKLLLVALLVGGITTSSCSQVNKTGELASADTFVGSTPCDSLIRSLLQVSPIIPCEFIKWRLNLYKAKADSGTFQLDALYGISQPNTNGFIGGGTKLVINGNYTISNGTAESPRRRLYHLNGNTISSPLLLIEMDEHILHFADGDRRFLIGNGGFGYVLNRVK